MADLYNRAPSWTDYLPAEWQSAINTSPVINALSGYINRRPADIEGASNRIFGQPGDREAQDRNWLLQQARGPSALERMNPVAQDGANKLMLLANFFGPGVKLPAMAPKPTGIRAYHGSPHDFNAERLVRYPDGRTEYVVGVPDRLPDIPQGAELVRDYPFGRVRMDKIGTGEGAQAYGRGFYGAENEGVARSYRDGLAGKAEPAKFATPDEAKRAAGIGGSIIEASQSMGGGWRAMGADGEFIRSGPSPGRMYEVNIKADPDQFLDWDKPLSQQPEGVRRALEAANLVPWKTRNPLGIEYGNLSKESALALSSRGRRPIEPDLSATGGDLLNWEVGAGRPVAKQETSDRLRDAGIPGIKYLDQQSRTAGQGSRNFVVFDDALVEILRKYGLLPPVAAGTAAALNQQEPPL